MANMSAAIEDGRLNAGSDTKEANIGEDEASGSVHETEASTPGVNAVQAPAPAATTTTEESNAAAPLFQSSSTDDANAASAQMSMSAGADPWADPVVGALPGAVSNLKAAGDNPWATSSQTASPVLGSTNEQMLTPSKHVDRHASSRDRGADEKMADNNPPLQEAAWGEYGLPRLGHAARKFWLIKKDFTPLNNGSYGHCPRPVCDAYKALQDRQEESPDVFRRFAMKELLLESCAKVAKLLNCDAEDCVMITNATTGTNAVLRDMVYSSDDAVLFLSTGYGAVERNIQYLIDMEAKRGVTLHKVAVPIRLPCSHRDLMESFDRTIEEAQKQGKRIRVGVIDTICSIPGVKMPWEQMTKHLRERQILSLVDGAHGIGQIPIDLAAADPDFFVSNCHKWLYAHRGCAVFYTAKRNKGIQVASLPIGWEYESNPTPESNTWWSQWATPGTSDNSSLMTVSAALDFRQMLGGEERIMAYKHDLAIKGGQAAAQILGTSIMDVAGNPLTAAMVNVRLPLVFTSSSSGRAADEKGADSEWDAASDLIWTRGGQQYFFETQMSEFKLVTMVYSHNAKVWARLSAEVYLEVSDFEYAARVLLEICRRINAGEALRKDDAASLAA